MPTSLPADEEAQKGDEAACLPPLYKSNSAPITLRSFSKGILMPTSLPADEEAARLPPLCKSTSASITLGPF